HEDVWSHVSVRQAKNHRRNRLIFCLICYQNVTKYKNTQYIVFLSINYTQYIAKDAIPFSAPYAIAALNGGNGVLFMKYLMCKSVCIGYKRCVLAQNVTKKCY